MKVSALVKISLVASVSLGVYALESLIPPIIPIPGVKLGIANTVTLVSLYLFGAKNSFMSLMVRVLISSLLFAHPVSFLFSLTGGLVSFFVMAFLKRFFSDDSIWALSVFGAFGHNIGQIAVAIFITRQLAVAYYFLFLVISAVVTGVFTGLCAMYTVKKLKKIIKY